MAHSGQDLELVLFKFHARSAAEAQPPPSQFALETLYVDLKAGRQAFDGGHQARAV
jgi:hypothetical protein